jgi:ApbE superfamily uncharacterized protein (UPF0280 family)
MPAGWMKSIAYAVLLFATEVVVSTAQGQNHEPSREERAVQAAQSALREHFPQHPEFRFTTKPDRWIVEVFSQRRGDKAGGRVTIMQKDFSVADVEFYQ